MKKKTLDYLKSLGIDPTTIQSQIPVEQEQHTKDMNRHQAESLLWTLKWPYPEMMPQKCLGCNRTFLTNYAANRYCSQRCIKSDFEKIGLKWNPDRSFQEQWGNLEPPLMIPPEAIQAMRRLLQILDSETQDLQRYQEPDSLEEILISEPLASNDPQVLDNGSEIQQEHETDRDEISEFLASLDE